MVLNKKYHRKVFNMAGKKGMTRYPINLERGKGKQRK